MLQVDVIIPVHNSVHWVRWCLEELVKFKGETVNRIVVIDDASSVDQAKRLVTIVSAFAGVELLANTSTEHGFGAACNFGFAQCSSPLILFLNTDCLITEGTIEKLAQPFEWDASIALSCPVSNNSPILTYPMFPGRNYREMNAICDRVFKESPHDAVVDVCTVVGNCLMVRATFFAAEGGFSSEWGVGYGEETDLHLKAFGKGLRGVAVLSAYVYHYGGGTFNYADDIEEHRKKNQQLFMTKWGRQYKALQRSCEHKVPTDVLTKAISAVYDGQEDILTPDVLFYLPGISQTIGGIHAVITLCNALLRQGINATCALVGTFSSVSLSQFKEPVLFNFLYFNSDQELLKDIDIFPKVIVSTIFTSDAVCANYAKINACEHVQFVQGYEAFFENGTRFKEAVDSYQSAKKVITTSLWLSNMVKRHLSEQYELTRLPLLVNHDIFYNDGNNDREFDITFVIRSAADKGQWILLELIDRLIAHKQYAILILKSSGYQLPNHWLTEKIQVVDLPIDQYSMAAFLRKTKVFVDASLHEGFGLIPYEAQLCGAKLVCSNSGGVCDFVVDGVGEIVQGALDFDQYEAAIKRQLIVSKNAVSDNKSSRYSTEDSSGWVDYFTQFIQNQPVVAPVHKIQSKLKKLTVHNVSRRKNSPRLTLVLANVYIKLLPYIPARVHLALRVLVYGK